jgi:type IV secretory pathway VirB4 component
MKYDQMTLSELERAAAISDNPLAKALAARLEEVVDALEYALVVDTDKERLEEISALYVLLDLSKEAPKLLTEECKQSEEAA